MKIEKIYNENVKCLVLWYPAVFPKETDLGKRFLYFEKISSPTLLIHGEKDTVVPFSHSKRLFELLKCQKKLIKIPKVYHSFKNKDFTIDYNFQAQQKATELTCKWFEKWLK
jgi:dipeptidyl aminopeptidase/acylaminoacyl peptidase